MKFLHERIEPLSDFVLIRMRKDENERSEGGLIIPEQARTKTRAKVVAVGPGRYEYGHHVPMNIKPGDHVILIPSRPGNVAGIKVPSEDQSADYALVHRSDIAAIEREAPIEPVSPELLQ